MKYNAQQQSHTMPNVTVVSAIALALTAFGSPARAQTETVLHPFTGAMDGFAVIAILAVQSPQINGF